MGFARQTSIAVFLVTLTLLVQSAGMALLIHWARYHIGRGVKNLRPLHSAVFVVRFPSAMIVLHTLQIILWAAFYRLRCLSSWESSFYFSSATYSTVGYGDIVLPGRWRLLRPVESITGVLMCGLTVSCLFAIVARLVEGESENSQTA